MSTQEMISTVNPSRRENLQRFSWKQFLVLTLAGLFGSIASIPSLWQAIEKTANIAHIPAQLLVVEQIVQSAIWMLITVGAGLLLSNKTGLGVPLLRDYLDRKPVGHRLRPHILPSVSLAVIATIAVKALDIWFFIPHIPGFSSVISQIAGWEGILASFYGGITEEILTRLFFLTLLAWILSWFSHTEDNKPSPIAMWIAILGSAIIFGLGHLPATLLTTRFSLIVLAREVLLNGILGTLFGYLYWKRGLESSMMAHFSADLIVHFILPPLSI